MSFLKNVADSLANRTLPSVAKNIFPQESNKITDFNEKLESAKEMFDTARTNVISTGQAFKGTGPVSRRLSRQLRSGKFGRDADADSNYMMKQMGIDTGDSDPSSGNADDGLSELDQFDIGGDSDPSNEPVAASVDNSVYNANIINAGAFNEGGVTDGDALLNERITLSSQMASQIGAKTIGLLSGMAASLVSIKDLLENSGREFYAGSLEHYNIQSKFAEDTSRGMENVFTYYKDAVDKLDAAKAKKLSLGLDPDSDIGNVLDPARAMEKLTSGTMDQMFGEMSPIKAMLDGASNDPLGTIVGAMIGAGVTNLFSSQIERIKEGFDSVQYRVQDTLENWSNINEHDESSGALDSLKKKIGNTFKVDRRVDADLNVGSYDTNATAFTTQTNKAIIDVIPMYLSKILKVLTKSDHHEVYDWERSSFNTTESINKRTKDAVLDIDEGNNAGGLGHKLNSILGNEALGLNEEDKKALRKELLHHSLSRTSSDINLSNLQLSTENNTTKLQEVMNSLTPTERTELAKTFRGHRNNRMRELTTYEHSIASTGREQALILGDEDLSITGEHAGIAPRLERTRDTDYSREDPRGGGSPGGRDPDNGRRSQFDRGLNSLERSIEKLSHWFDSATTKVSTVVDTKLLTPIKNFLGATGSDDEVRSTSLLSLMSKKIDTSILLPLKTSLVGDKKAQNMSLWKSISQNLSRNVGIPIKRLLLGKDATTRELASKGFFQSLNEYINKNILLPFKKKLVGEERANEMGFFRSLYTRFDESALTPFKHLLLGKENVDIDTAKRTSLLKSLSNRFDESILIPFKHLLLGKGNVDRATAASTSLLKSIGTRIDASILFPLKKLLTGGNETKAKGFTIWKAIGHRMDRSVFFPLKKLLLGGNERSGAEIARTSLFTSLKTGFTERVIQPLNSMLFGDDKRKLGFFANLSNTMSPFFNKMLFGQDAASKAGFVENLKLQSKKLWGNLWEGAKDKFFKPAMNTVKELFGPVFKEFFSTVGAELKHFGSTVLKGVGNTISGSMKGGIKAGAKNLFKDVFGDSTVKLLRDNVVAPLKDLTQKLTDNMSKVFKFILRLPLNFLKGVTDTMKINRLNSGRGNYSEAETARLRGLQRSGKAFNFLNLGGDPKHDPINALSETASTAKKASLFARLFGRNKGDSVESAAEVVAGVTGNKSAVSSHINRQATARKEAHRETKRETLNHAKVHGVPTSRIKAIGEAVTSPLSSISSVTSPILRAKPKTSEEAAKTASNVLVRVGVKLDGLVSQLNTLIVRRSIKETSATTASTHTSKLATPAAAHAATVKINSRLSTITPLVTSLSTSSNAILSFLKQNLSKVDARVENVVKLMRKKKGANVAGVKGSNLSILRNPFQWLGNKFESVFGLGFKLVSATFNSIGKMGTALISIPGKIAGSVAELAVSLTKGVVDISSGLINAVSSGLKGLMNGMANVLTGLGTGLGKLVGGLADAIGGAISGIGSFVKNVAGPLGSALGQITASIAKGIVPIIGELSKGFGSLLKGVRVVAEGLGKVAWHAAGMLSNFTGGIANRLTGGKLFSAKGSTTQNVHVLNFGELISKTHASPMRVFVVGGQITAIPPIGRRKPRTTTFTDKVEARSLLGNKAKTDPLKGEDSSDGLSGAAASGIGSAIGSAAGTIGGKIATATAGKLGDLAKGALAALGISKLGAAFTALRTAAMSSALALLGKKPSNFVGPLPESVKRKGKFTTIKDKIKGAVTKRGATTAATSGATTAASTGAATSIGSKIAGLGGKVVSGAKGLFTKKAATTAATTAASTGAKTGALGIAGKAAGVLGKVAKGAGVAGVLSIGGGLAADALFDKGTFAHGALSSGSEYAGYGAMLGSVIPGVGTAVGAIVGGIAGVLKESLPRLLKWVETKFESQIRSATEVFIQIPEKLTMFVQDLPGRITTFTQELPVKMQEWMADIPSKIVSMFRSDDLTVGADGQVVEKQPSILGRMFVAMGSAVWTLVKSIPKIIASIGEGAVKLAMSGAITAGSALTNSLVTGISSIGLFLGKSFEQLLLAAKHKIGSTYVGKALGFGYSDEEYERDLKKLDGSYDEKALTVSNNSAKITEGSQNFAKKLTDWSVADKIPAPTGQGSISNKRRAYEDAQAKSKGDEKIAVQELAKTLKMSQAEAEKEFKLQKGEAKYRNDNGLDSNGISKAEKDAAFKITGGMTEGKAITEGVGGSYAQSPISKGDGWQNNKEVILYASRAVGVDPVLMAKIAAIESGFRPKVGAGTSSATGLYQFIKSTWNSQMRQHGGKLGIPAGTPATDARANALLGAMYIKESAQEAIKITGNATAQDVYMGHFLGQAGMRRFLRGLKASPTQVASNIVADNVPGANKSIFFVNENRSQPRTAQAVYSLLGQRVNNAAISHKVDLPGLDKGSYTGNYNEIAESEAGGYDGTSGSTTTSSNDVDAEEAKAMFEEYSSGLSKIGKISGMDGKVNHGLTTDGKTTLAGAGQLDASITAALNKYSPQQVQIEGGTKITPIGSQDTPEWNKTVNEVTVAPHKPTVIGSENTPEWNKTVNEIQIAPHKPTVIGSENTPEWNKTVLNTNSTKITPIGNQNATNLKNNATTLNNTNSTKITPIVSQNTPEWNKTVLNTNSSKRFTNKDATNLENNATSLNNANTSNSFDHGTINSTDNINATSKSITVSTSDALNKYNATESVSNTNNVIGSSIVNVLEHIKGIVSNIADKLYRATTLETGSNVANSTKLNNFNTSNSTLETSDNVVNNAISNNTATSTKLNNFNTSNIGSAISNNAANSTKLNNVVNSANLNSNTTLGGKHLDNSITAALNNTKLNNFNTSNNAVNSAANSIIDTSNIGNTISNNTSLNKNTTLGGKHLDNSIAAALNKTIVNNAKLNNFNTSDIGNAISDNVVNTTSNNAVNSAILNNAKLNSFNASNTNAISNSTLEASDNVANAISNNVANSIKLNNAKLNSFNASNTNAINSANLNRNTVLSDKHLDNSIAAALNKTVVTNSSNASTVSNKSIDNNEYAAPIIQMSTNSDDKVAQVTAKAAVASTPPKLEVGNTIDPVVAELRNQTKLLTDIAANTKDKPTPPQNNFFTTGEEKKEQPLMPVTQQMINNTRLDLAEGTDPFPSYLSPSLGALAVSKGGS